MKLLEENSVDCCVTSPPYFGLRDYGYDDQIGKEETPEIFIKKLVTVFREVKRVLKQDGTLWVNIGDSYATSSPGKGGGHATGKRTGKMPQRKRSLFDGSHIKFNVKQKDLLGIPWMLAFALRADGWYLRQDIIWHKPNPMPESVTDRCTKAHEYIFLLSKSPQYYYDFESIKTPLKKSSTDRLAQDIENQNGSDRAYGGNRHNGKMKAVGGAKHKNLKYNGQQNHSHHRTRNEKGEEFESVDGKANKRSVWTVTTKGYKEAHFATFPEKLIVDCIKAGCPEKILSCNCCRYEVNLMSNTKANEATYKGMQELWDKVSGNRSVEQRENILYKEVQFGMDSQAQEEHKGMDNNEQGIQNDTPSRASKRNEIRVHDGAQVSNGEEIGEIFKEERSSPPHQWNKTGQHRGESTSIGKENSRQISKASDKDDRLSSLWEENKNIGPCPKCSEGTLIGKRGIILDCFMGAGTTAVVARKLNRDYVGFELNSDYIDIAKTRLSKELGMFENQ